MRFLVFAAALSIATFGCSKKSEECKAVIDTIDDDDAALKGLKFDTEDFGLLAKNVKAAADTLDKLAADLAEKKVTDPDLIAASGDYQNFAKALAKALRDHAVLLEQLDSTLTKIGPMNKTLRDGLKKLHERCATDAATNDCEAVKKVMKDAPDQDAFKFDKDLKEDAEAFSKFVAELRALNVTITDQKIKDDVEQIAKGLSELETIMRSMSDLKPKFDKSQSDLLAVVAKEAPIEKHINATCAAK